MRIGWWKTGGAPCCLVFCDSKLGLQGIGSRRSNSRRSRAKTSGSRRSRRTSREVTAHVCAGKWRRRKLRETVRQRHRLHLFSQSRVPLGRTAICIAARWKTLSVCMQILPPHPSRQVCLISSPSLLTFLPGQSPGLSLPCPRRRDSKGRKEFAVGSWWVLDAMGPVLLGWWWGWGPVVGDWWLE